MFTLPIAYELTRNWAFNLITQKGNTYTVQNAKIKMIIHIQYSLAYIVSVHAKATGGWAPKLRN